PRYSRLQTLLYTLRRTILHRKRTVQRRCFCLPRRLRIRCYSFTSPPAPVKSLNSYEGVIGFLPIGTSFLIETFANSPASADTSKSVTKLIGCPPSYICARLPSNTITIP